MDTIVIMPMGGTTWDIGPIMRIVIEGIAIAHIMQGRICTEKHICIIEQR
jgi:hypothetical protein